MWDVVAQSFERGLVGSVGAAAAFILYHILTGR